MSAGQALEGIAKLFTLLLPIAGVIALVYLAFLFKKLIETLKELDKTIVIVNDQVQKLDDPLHTVQELSHTVDDVHHATRNAVENASKSAKANAEKVKEWASQQDFSENMDEVKSWAKDKTSKIVDVADTVKEYVKTK